MKAWSADARLIWCCEPALAIPFEFLIQPATLHSQFLTPDASLPFRQIFALEHKQRRAASPAAYALPRESAICNSTSVRPSIDPKTLFITQNSLSATSEETPARAPFLINSASGAARMRASFADAESRASSPFSAKQSKMSSIGAFVGARSVETLDDCGQIARFRSIFADCSQPLIAPHNGRQRPERRAADLIV